MNRDPRQLAYLKAMDIDLWVRRDAVPATPVVLPTENTLTIRKVSAAEIASEITTPSMPDMDMANVSELDWPGLAQQVANCQLCELHATRKQAVFGVGNQQADWLIIGEAPGAEEDRQGEPFVGRAGQLLNAMLKAIGLKREQVYIANILKCRPPNNRDPRPEEAACCSPYLQRQIELIQPRLILALGRIAAQRLLQTNTSLARLRGKVHTLESTQSPVIVTYHPAYLLRSPAEKRKAWQDLQYAQHFVARAMAAGGGS
jgi:uracil-DNA glycosylase family 4